MMEFDVEEVTAYLHQHIPVTRAMQFSVLPLSEGALKLSAKLTPNLNHQETAFGGSIASLGILAGWTLIHLRLRADLQKYKIVIQKSEILLQSALCPTIVSGHCFMTAFSENGADELC